MILIDQAIERQQSELERLQRDLAQLRQAAQRLQQEIFRREGGLSVLLKLKQDSEAQEGHGEDETDAPPLNERSAAREPAAA